MDRASIWSSPAGAGKRLLIVAGTVAALTIGSVGTAVAQDEVDTLRLGYRTNDIGSSAPVWIALDKGFYADECGLTVEAHLIDEVDAALIGGSLDLMIFDPDGTADRINNGLPLVMIAGWREREPMIIGVGEGIETVDDLAGADVALGLGPGDPATNFRINALKDAGWDLEAAGVNFVNPPGFSNARVELLKEGQLGLTYMFPRHREQITDAGGQVIIDVLNEEMGDVISTNPEFLAANPNALACWIAQTIRGKEILADPANQAEVVEIVKGHDVPAEPADQEPWDAHYITHSMDMAIMPDNLAANLLFSGVEDPGYEALTDLSALMAAWELLGIEGRTQ